MAIVSVYKDQGFLYKVDLSVSYQASIHGHFTTNQDANFKFYHLMGLTESQAYSVAGLANACYELGYARAKREIAEKLGLFTGI